MSEPEQVWTIEERKAEDGTIARRSVPYDAPVFPDRPYAIVETATNHPLLSTPGGMVEVQPATKNGRAKVDAVYEPRPYKTLKIARDKIHATRFTAEEAKITVLLWKLSNETHKITKNL